jgi:hypothetical protein
MHLLILLGSSRYSVLTNFGVDLFNALKKMGCEASVYVESNGTEADILNDIELIVREKSITHVVSFNGAVLEIFKNERFSNVIFVAWMVDYPAYHFPRLNSGFSNTHVICANQDHRFYINEITTSKFLGVMLPGAPENQAYDAEPLSQRPFDLVIAGSWMGEPEPFWEKITQKFLRQAIKEIIDELTQDDLADVYLTMKGTLARYQIKFDDAHKSYSQLINTINDYLRKYSRLKMMSAVALSGLQTIIVGEGWEGKYNHSNLHFHPSAEYKKMPIIYQNAKIAINLNSNSGASERALQALASGCHVFSFLGKSIQLVASQGHPVYCESSSQSLEAIADALRTSVAKASSTSADIGQVHSLNAWPVVAQQLTDYLKNLKIS